MPNAPKLALRSTLAAAVAAVIGAASIACGTLGSIASPTPVVLRPSPTPTLTLTDMAKADIAARFDAQLIALNRGDFEAAYEMCAPDYRAQRGMQQYTKAINDYLSRYNVTPLTFDARELVVRRGTAERYDVSYDIYIDGEFAESINNAGGYIIHHGVWYDDHALCR